MAKHVCAEHVPIFNHLDHDSLVLISEIMEHRVYQKGDLIFSPQHPGSLVILAGGRVKIYQYTADGKEQLLRVAEQGEVLGENSLFDMEESSTYGEALTATEVCMMSSHDFRMLLMKYPMIGIRLLEEYSRRLKEVQSYIARTADGEVIDRLRDYLKQQALAQHCSTFALPLTMRELAAYLGTTPETLSRRFRALLEEGYITRKGRTVTLREMD